MHPSIDCAHNLVQLNPPPAEALVETQYTPGGPAFLPDVSDGSLYFYDQEALQVGIPPCIADSFSEPQICAILCASKGRDRKRVCERWPMFT